MYIFNHNSEQSVVLILYFTVKCQMSLCLWHVLSECHCCESLSSPVPITMWSSCPHFCPLLCWEVASQQPHSQSRWCRLSNPPNTTALLVAPTLSFSQFPAAPLGSWVLSEKLFLTEPPQVPANGSLGSRCPHDGVWPMTDTHNCTLPEGKVHSESMNVSIFNLSGRKWDAKQHFLQLCLNITQATRATQRGAQINTLACNNTHIQKVLHIP